MRWIWWKIVVAACAGPERGYTFWGPDQQHYEYQGPPPTEPEAGDPVSVTSVKARARVVAATQAEATGLAGETLAMPFTTPADGTQLVADYLARADQAGARYVTDLAIYLQTTRDDRAVECRSDVVPETFTETVHRPGRFELVPTTAPVQRTVTDHEYRCKSVTKYESKMVTEYEQRCRTERRPVRRSRTVYRSEYDSFRKSTRSVPRTEWYTDYESHNECKREPVTRYKSEPVRKQDCKLEPVTRTVTRYEYQLENRYVPARFDQISRQRLRELEPECYALEETVPGLAPQNRVEGRIFFRTE